MQAHVKHIQDGGRVWGTGLGVRGVPMTPISTAVSVGINSLYLVVLVIQRAWCSRFGLIGRYFQGYLWMLLLVVGSMKSLFISLVGLLAVAHL